MGAELVIEDSFSTGGGVVYLKVWRVPEPVPPSEHPFKYRLAYIVGGERIVGYDNERGKGDHKHLQGCEMDYLFTDIAQLVDDFMADVREVQWNENI